MDKIGIDMDKIDAEPSEPRIEPAPTTPADDLPTEIGGAPGPDPTRHGDWSHKGRCTDF